MIAQLADAEMLELSDFANLEPLNRLRLFLEKNVKLSTVFQGRGTVNLSSTEPMPFSWVPLGSANDCAVGEMWPCVLAWRLVCNLMCLSHRSAVDCSRAAQTTSQQDCNIGVAQHNNFGKLVTEWLRTDRNSCR